MFKKHSLKITTGNKGTLVIFFTPYSNKVVCSLFIMVSQHICPSQGFRCMYLVHMLWLRVAYDTIKVIEKLELIINAHVCVCVV